MEGIIKGKSIRLPARASLWYVGTSVITKAVGVLVTPIFTRLLTGTEYGAYSLYMSYLGLFSVICTASFSSGVIYKGFQKFSNKKESFLSAALGFSLSFCVIICALLFVFNSLLGLGYALTALLCIQLIADTSVGLALMRERYAYRYMTVVLVGVFESVAAPLISLILLFGTGESFVCRLWGLLIPAVIAATPLVKEILRRSSRLYDGDIWKYLIRRCAPLFPSVFSGAVSSQAGNLILVAALGHDALAKYSITHSIGIGLLFVVSSLGAALGPWITRKIAAGRIDTVREVGGLLFTLLGAATVFLVAIVPEALSFLAPPEYAEAIAAALPIALATLPSFITSIGSVGLIFAERGGSVSAASILGAGANLLFSFLLIPRLTYLGAGLALLLSNLFSALVTILFLRQAGLGKIVSTARALAIFTVTALLGVLTALLYEYAALRILLLILPALVIVRSAFSAKELISEI